MWYLWIGMVFGLVGAVIAGGKTGEPAAVVVAVFGGVLFWPLLVAAGLWMLLSSSS